MSESYSEDTVQTRIKKIVKKRQSSQRFNLSDEELVLLALAYSSDQWLTTAQIGEFALENSLFYQKQAAQFLFGASLYATPRGIGSLPSRIQK